MSIFTKDFSDEEMARDWTLSESDLKQISTVISSYRPYFAIQLCSIRLQGGFLAVTSDLSPRIINYLSSQLDLPLTFFVNEPTRRATRSKQHGQILTYLGFKKYDRETNIILKNWIVEKAEQGQASEGYFETIGRISRLAKSRFAKQKNARKTGGQPLCKGSF